MAPHGQRHTGYAVVTLETIVEAAPLPLGTTSQTAELVALIRALHLSKNLQGTPIVNGPLISKLLEALDFPSKVAIIHCRGNQTSQDLVSRGNNKADTVAKWLKKLP
ncbi:unnamed protein product [Nyctereutes procyonoides]|uniref:(raccoon dog) hypothetical protein n=1 Tax=Nyctereutes procyonoides TaxID=34880 RepID=A0A811ZT14_NYCPR|nr:unnamed protein product [Nyctereutes procyonoides]